MKKILSFIVDLFTWFCLSMLLIIIGAVGYVFPNLIVIALIAALLIVILQRLIGLICNKKKQNSDENE